jgi:Rrf2 family transcriptional regulator, iron-sulfur cluster assembly transcription factor
MNFSKACEYGLRASLYVAVETERAFFPIKEIGKALGISHHFLTKVLQDLTRAKIMKSLRGPNGGVALGAPADSIFLYDIVVAIDGIERFEGCVLGLPGCGELRPCPLHDYWGTKRGEIRDKFQSITLEEMATRIREEGLRISTDFKV